LPTPFQFRKEWNFKNFKGFEFRTVSDWERKSLQSKENLISSRILIQSSYFIKTKCFYE
jgi:hypothetical protein